MLAFAPFAQQAVKIEPSRLVLAGSGTIPRVTGYEPELNFEQTEVAIRDGLTTLAVPSLVSGHCPTSNCTWEPYTTFGICSSTENATDKIRNNCNGDACNLTIDGTWLYGSSEFQNVSWNSSDFTTSPPNVWIAMNGSSFTSAAARRGHQPTPDNPLVTSANQSYPSNFADLYVVYQPGHGYQAIKATMSICIQTLHTTMTNGTTNTTLVSTELPPKWEPVPDKVYAGKIGALGFSAFPDSVFSLAQTFSYLFNGSDTTPSVHSGDPVMFLSNDIFGTEATYKTTHTQDPQWVLKTMESRFSNVAQGVSNSCVANSLSSVLIIPSHSLLG